MAPSLFSKGLFQQLVLHAEFGEHLLQPSVFILDRLLLGNPRRVHPAILRAPLLEQRVAHAMVAAQLGHRHAAFGLTQDRKDLFIGAYAAPPGATVPSSSVYLLVFIRNLLVHLAEKILLMQPPTFGGITQQRAARRPVRPLRLPTSLFIQVEAIRPCPGSTGSWNSGCHRRSVACRHRAGSSSSRRARPAHHKSGSRPPAASAVRPVPRPVS